MMANKQLDGGDTMKAIVQHRYGSADVLELRGIETGNARGKVIIAVSAMGGA